MVHLQIKGILNGNYFIQIPSALKSFMKDPTLRIDGCAVNYYLALDFCAMGGFYNILI